MELTLEELSKHVEKYYEVNGKYPSNIRISKKTKADKSAINVYCIGKGIKVNYV